MNQSNDDTIVFLDKEFVYGHYRGIGSCWLVPERYGIEDPWVFNCYPKIELNNGSYRFIDKLPNNMHVEVHASNIPELETKAKQKILKLIEFSSNDMAAKKKEYGIIEDPPSWSREWPEKEGSYWFYGNSSFNRKFPDEKLRLELAKVTKISNGFMYVLNGHFIFKSEGWEGYWLPVTFPELPKDT